MELPVGNSSPESARKSPEGVKVENASTASAGEKVSEGQRSSEDVTKPKEDEVASEAEGTSGSGTARQGEKSVTSERRETSPTRQEPPAALEAEAAKIAPESTGANELPEAREVRADPVEPPIVEIAGKKPSPPTADASKSHSAEKSMTSGGSGSPEVGAAILRDEDDETNDADDEVVEHDEEIGTCLEQPEVGIVGPPTAVRDLVNDEELGTTESSSLPGDGRNNDAAPSSDANAAPNVAEWIERSRLTKNTGLKVSPGKTTRRRKRSPIATNATHGTARKSQKIVTNIIRRSIKCLNKMHAAAEYGGSGGGGTTVKKLDQSEKRDEDSRGSPKVPQSRQNGAALPEETAIAAIATTMANATVNSERLRPTVVKSENHSETDNEEEEETTADAPSPKERSRSRRTSITDETTPTTESRNSRKKSPTNNGSSRLVAKSERGENNPRKRRSNDETIGCGQQLAKKIRSEQRERYIDSLVGTTERISADELATRADELRAEVQALDELARAKEMEWNEILSMRKLKEEAYLRIERRRQIVGYMESNGQSVSSDNLPPASLSLTADWESTVDNATTTTTTTTATTRTKSQDTATSSRDNVKDSGAATESDPSMRLLDTTRESQKADETCRERSPAASTKREQKGSSVATGVKSSNNAQRRTASPKQLAENGRKQQQQQRNQQQQQRQQQQLSEQSALDNRQIGEGRQGPIVDVRSIIADYRLRHPESVPRRYDSKRESPARGRETSANTRTSGLINVRRGRRMRNSVNIGLGAGGAMVETSAGGGAHHHHHHHDSRPSSTDSCKSSNERTSAGPAATPTTSDPNNSMSFKDVLVQFAKLSQQQGEPVKTPQNYPDVTLHPVAPTTVTINSAPTNQQTTGSLLHGILTKSQSPRPTTFSPTLARLLTAPERERTNLPTSITAIPQQNIQTQHLLQTYQGSNPVSISDLLSSSKARTEITITPVVTPIAPGHVSQSNSLVHVDDVEEETSLIDERDSRLGSGARDSRDERDSPPRCQGCQERAAQFVCAGCGNQWYCSRDCQVAAWDDHSEVCSG